MCNRIAVLLTLALLCAFPACAAEDYAEIAGTYELSSGVGAWFTELVVEADGSIHGHYQDTDMDGGELEGIAYEATIYASDFTGRLTGLKSADEWELDCKVGELSWEEGDSYVEDGALYIPGPPNGLNRGDALRFFREGAPAEALPESFLVWVRMREGEVRWESLPYDGLYNESADAGFSGITKGAEVWLPLELKSEPTQAPQATSKPQWRFLNEAPEEAAAPTAAPSDIDSGAAEDTSEDDIPEGIAYPVQAEVVNCKTGVSLRQSPSTKAALLAEVPLGALVTVYSNEAWLGNERWFVDASYNGQRGYICVEYLDVILPDSLSTQRAYLKGTEGIVSAVNRGSDLILRDGPGTEYESLGLLFGGEVLGYLGDSRRDDSGTCWYHCTHYGEKCWISAKFTALTTNDGKTYTGSRGNMG